MFNDKFFLNGEYMEQPLVEQNIARRSAMIYIPISLGIALTFFLASSFVGTYPLVAKIGGTVWVGLLSLIVSMPIVTSHIKRKSQNLV